MNFKKLALPKNKISVFNLALKAITANFGTIIKIKKLTGLSNYNFLVEYVGSRVVNLGTSKFFVLKILNLNPVTNNTNEELINQELNQLQITPKILLADFPKYYVIDYIKGKKVTTKWFNDNNNLAGGLVNLLQKLHSKELYNKASSLKYNVVDFYKTNTSLLNTLKVNKSISGLQHKLQFLAVKLNELPVNLAFCHNDLNQQNLIVEQNNNLWLIDFEYSGISDVFFDLASLKANLGLKQYQKLLNSYKAKLLAEMPRRLFNYKLKLFNLMLSATSVVWYLYMSKNSKNSYNKYYQTKFNGLYLQFNYEFNQYFNNYSPKS